MKPSNKIALWLLVVLLVARYGGGVVPSPAPIPADKLTVLIVYEASDKGKLTQAQSNILTSTILTEYLQAKGAMYRIIDQNDPPAGLPPPLQVALARPRTSLPWIVIANQGKGAEGPLPADVTATLALLKKYGGA